MRGLARLPVLILVLSVVFLVPAVAGAGTLTVGLKTANGKGVGDADVKIQNLDGSKSKTGKTGKPGSGLNGKAEFKDLEPGTYKVTITKDGRTYTDYARVGDKPATRDFLDEGLIKPPPGAKPSGDIFKDLESWVEAYKQAALKAKHKKDAAGQKAAEAELKKIQESQDNVAGRLELYIDDIIKGLPAWVRDKLKRRFARSKTEQEKITNVRNTINSVDKKIKKDKATLKNFGAMLSPKARKELEDKIKANEQARKDVTALGNAMEAAQKHKKISSAAKDAQAGVKDTKSAAKLKNPNTQEQSCFTAGTLVRMADGSLRSIEELRTGDQVVGQYGVVNTVVGVERPRLGGRLLYAFNGGRPFVTAEHPFMTGRGWRSIDPTATRAENSALVVQSLIPGDRLVGFAEGIEPIADSTGTGSSLLLPAAYGLGAKSLFAIRTIEALRGDPETRVYNLLLDGNHTYFADGYLVHNKEAGDGAGQGNGGDSGS